MEVPHGQLQELALIVPVFPKRCIIDFHDLQGARIVDPGGIRVLIEDLPVFLLRGQYDLLGPLPCRNILYSADDPQGPVIGRINDIPTVMHISIVAVALLQSVFVLPLGDFRLRDDTPLFVDHSAFILRMQDALPEILGADGIHNVVAEQLFVCISYQKNLIGNKVPVPDSIIGSFYDGVETLIALHAVSPYYVCVPGCTGWFLPAGLH